MVNGVRPQMDVMGKSEILTRKKKPGTSFIISLLKHLYFPLLAAKLFPHILFLNMSAFKGLG